MLRKSFVSFVVLLAISMFGINNVWAGWHEWSQGTRNQAILNEAYKDLGKNFSSFNPPLNCKLWVQQRVIKNASGGLVTLPATVDPPGWYWSPHQYVRSRCGRIEDAQPGEIVQMYTIYGYPHTAIIVAKSQSGITFIECNWCLPACYIVSKRDVSYLTFYQQVCGSYFTIHTIL